MARSPRPFLTAEWRHLAMLNFAIDPATLAPWLPRGTELDPWNGTTLVSVVGFLFLKTRVHGIAIPFHRDFEEVNLRFYVRRRAGAQWRRGVVFVRELVPRRVIALAARTLYQEPYLAVPMGHTLHGNPAAPDAVEYRWRFGGRQHRLHLRCSTPPAALVPGSEAEFIAEHYWGYNARRDGSSFEYQVEHPPWRVRAADSAHLECDPAALYGDRFRESLAVPPVSAFLAEGSPVRVHHGRPLP